MKPNHPLPISALRGFRGRRGVPAAKCAPEHRVLEPIGAFSFQNTVFWSTAGPPDSKTPCFGAQGVRRVPKRRVLEYDGSAGFQNTVFWSTAGPPGSKTPCFGAQRVHCVPKRSVLKQPRRWRFQNTVFLNSRAGGGSKTPCFRVAAPVAVLKRRVFELPRRRRFQNTVFLSSRAGGGSKTRCFKAQKSCGARLRCSFPVIPPAECPHNSVLRQSRSRNIPCEGYGRRWMAFPSGGKARRSARAGGANPFPKSPASHETRRRARSDAPYLPRFEQPVLRTRRLLT